MIMHPTIPSIDFNTFLHGSASDHLRIASAIDGALSSVGFIRLHNHGIEQRKIDECFQWDCAKLIHQLLECLSLALNLSAEDSLRQYHTSSLFDLGLIHYPAEPVGQLSSGRLIRFPAHSDCNTLTLLFQDELGGLEIADMSSTSSVTIASVDKSGRFIHIDPNPETLIVNVGYLLMMWSHGRWKNTVHKVSEPPHWRKQGLQGSNLDEKGGGGVEEIPERYSIAYFGSPDPKTIIKAQGGLIDVGEYLLQKRAAMMSA